MNLVQNDTWYILGGSHQGIRYANATVYQQGNFYDGYPLPYGAFFPCLVRLNETHFFFSGGENQRKEAYIVEIASWTWTQIDDMIYERYNCALVSISHQKTKFVLVICLKFRCFKKLSTFKDQIISPGSHSL